MLTHNGYNIGDLIEIPYGSTTQIVSVVSPTATEKQKWFNWWEYVWFSYGDGDTHVYAIKPEYIIRKLYEI